MPIPTTSALDAFLRHQINVERYKNYNVQQSLRVVNELKLRLSARLVRMGKDKISDLNKRDFNQFLRDFKADYADIFGKYETAQLAEFKKFFKADFGETKYLFKQLGGSSFKGATVDSLWAKMLKQPASGIGVEPNNLFKVFSNSIQTKMNSALKIGYTDNLSMVDVIKSITGTKELKFRDGLINKFESQLSTTIQTYIQQMTNFIAGSIGGALHSTYQWCSILDGVTTQICRDRDGHIYVYGDGPIPPAHYNCRSFTIPVIVSAIKDMPTFYAWLGAQPATIQDEVLGPRQGAALRAGKVKADEIPSFNQMSPLTLDQFKAKREQLLTPR
jgi:SPP1 gp7 family putative phage head morphogenesis protein